MGQCVYVAERNYRRSGANIPHPSLSLAIERAPDSAFYDTIFLILTANNTGSALCRIPAIEWTISPTAPYTDNDVMEMSLEFDQRDQAVPNTEFPWRVEAEATNVYNKSVEAGQSGTIIFEYPIPKLKPR